RTSTARTPAVRRTHWRAVLGGLAVAASVALGLLLVGGGETNVDPAGSVATTDSTDTTTRAVMPPLPDDATSAPVRGTGGAAVPDAAPRIGPALPQAEMRVAESGIPVSGGLADLADDQLEALLRRLDAIDALPQTSPA